MPARCSASPTPIRRFIGGEMWMAMDPPTADQRAAGRHPQHPRLHHPRRGDARSRRLRRCRRAGLAQAANSGRRILPDARRVHAHATAASPIKEGVVRGPMIGATVEGYIDYAARRRPHARHVRAALRPQQHVRADSAVRPVPRRRQQRRPVGITYEVVGPPGAPVLRVNPISAVAPGLFRKFFEFPTGARRAKRRASRISAHDRCPKTGSHFSGSCGSLNRLQQHVALSCRATA